MNVSFSSPFPLHEFGHYAIFLYCTCTRVFLCKWWCDAQFCMNQLRAFLLTAACFKTSRFCCDYVIWRYIHMWNDRIAYMYLTLPSNTHPHALQRKYRMRNWYSPNGLMCMCRSQEVQNGEKHRQLQLTVHVTPALTYTYTYNCFPDTTDNLFN